MPIPCQKPPHFGIPAPFAAQIRAIAPHNHPNPPITRIIVQTTHPSIPVAQTGMSAPKRPNPLRIMCLLWRKGDTSPLPLPFHYPYHINRRPKSNSLPRPARAVPMPTSTRLKPHSPKPAHLTDKTNKLALQTAPAAPILPPRPAPALLELAEMRGNKREIDLSALSTRQQAAPTLSLRA